MSLSSLRMATGDPSQPATNANKTESKPPAFFGGGSWLIRRVEI